jgi:hypothetical protein
MNNFITKKNNLFHEKLRFEIENNLGENDI